MRFVSLQSVVCRMVRGTLGFPRCRRLAVSSLAAAFPGRPFPATCAAGSFSRASRPLRSSFACLPGLPLRFGSVLPGVSPLFAASPGGVYLRGGFPASATFRPQVFSTSRRLAPPLGFAGLFHPATTSRVSVQGFVPASQPRQLVAGRASLPLPPRRSPVARLPRHVDWTSRL
jgi:hypothetical protein